MELHPFLRKDDIAEFCAGHSIAVIAYSPLARALRLDHPVLAGVAQAHGVSSTQVMVRWSMQHGYVPLPKSVRAERICSEPTTQKRSYKSDVTWMGFMCMCMGMGMGMLGIGI